MKKALNIYKVTALSMLGFSAISAAVRVVLLMKYIEIDKDDESASYFIQSNVYTVSFIAVVCAAAVAVTLVICLLFNKKAVVYEALSPNNCGDMQSYPSPLIFTTALSGFMLLSTGIYLVYSYFAKSTLSVTDLILAVLMIVTSAAFLRSSLVKGDSKKSGNTMLLKLLPVIAVMYRLITVFVISNRYPTTSSSAFHILSIVFLMLFLALDAKNIGYGVNSKLFAVSAMLSLLLVMLYAVPNLVLSCFWLLKLDDSALVSATEIVLALYAFAKVYSMLPPCAKINDNVPVIE